MSTKIPASFAGPWFKLAQTFPATAPTNDAPWLSIDFKAGMAGANAYLIRAAGLLIRGNDRGRFPA